MFKYAFYCLIFLNISIPSFASLIPETSSQLIVVTTSGWDAHKGELSYCKNEATLDQNWKCSKLFEVVVGKNGLGWGRGIKEFNLEGPIKKEGDNKGPAGIFTLGTAFGHTRRRYIQDLKMPYLELSESIEAVDDPDSKFYNKIIDNKNVQTDWQSSEKMGKQPLYLRGIVVNHNTKDTIPGFGSQIFMHIWNHAKTGTAGCTAMSFEAIKLLLASLDKNRNPILVQLPKSIYSDMTKEKLLPIIEN